jgi:hypothetical protein
MPTPKWTEGWPQKGSEGAKENQEAGFFEPSEPFRGDRLLINFGAPRLQVKKLVYRLGTDAD